MCYLLSLEKGEDPETLKARLNKFCSGTVDHSLSSFVSPGTHPHSKDFTPMSTSPVPDDIIERLQEQVANMADQIARLQKSKESDNQLQEQLPATIFYPSAEEAERYPPIYCSDPLSFFQNDVPDDEFWDQFHRFPKNATMGYEPPKVPSIIHLSHTQKSHDQQLRGLQKRLVHLTRPVDLFLHQVWSMEDDGPMDSKGMVELCSTFAILVREQLAATAGRINTIRMDNLRSSQGISYKKDKLEIVDPTKFQGEVKSFRTIINAFKPRQFQAQPQQDEATSNNDRSNSGYNNGHPRHNQEYRRDKNDNDNDNDGSLFHRDFKDRRRDNNDNNRHRRSDSQRRGRSSTRRSERRESEEDSPSS